MALKATVFKVQLQIADLQRHYYQQHNLTIARHPSENNLRMMARVLAFALFADEQLQFTKGLSTSEEPDLWQLDDSQQIVRWIEVGQPDERRIKQSCRRAQSMVVCCYNDNSGRIWWKGIADQLTSFDNVQVLHFDETALQQLGELSERNMELYCTIDEGSILVTCGEHSIEVAVEIWKSAAEQ